MEKFYGWWLSSGILRFGDGRRARTGIRHRIKGPVTLCDRGLHAARTVYSAVMEGSGNFLFFVELSGQMETNETKACSTQRAYLYRMPLITVRNRLVETLLMLFAQRDPASDIAEIMLGSSSWKEKKERLARCQLSDVPSPRNLFLDLVTARGLKPGADPVVHTFRLFTELGMCASHIGLNSPTLSDVRPLLTWQAEEMLPPVLLRQAVANGYVRIQHKVSGIQVFVSRASELKKA